MKPLRFFEVMSLQSIPFKNEISMKEKDKAEEGKLSSGSLILHRIAREGFIKMSNVRQDSKGIRL